MCTSPRILQIANRAYDNRRCDSLHYVASGVTSSRLVYCTCGQCAECLRSRQNDLALRCVRQAELSGSMSMVTLTYADEYLPLAMSLERVDKSSGVCEIIEKLKLLTRQENEEIDRCHYIDFMDELSKLDNSRCRYIYRNIFEDSSFLYRAVVTPSLNPRDLRLWLKYSRVAYEREFHVKLPDFKYVACGEMGKNTHRPHYHIVFFGLSPHIVQWLCSRWKFGFHFYRNVNAVNKDGSSGFLLAGKYIGKYISKGCFECQSVRDGYAYKCRLMTSKALGGSLSENVVNYFRCYDLIGEYDISTPLDSLSLKRLLPEIKKRYQFVIAGRPFKLSNRFLKQIWYVKDSKNHYVASAVRLQITNALLADLFADGIAKLKADCPSLSERQVIALYLRKKKLQQVCDEIKNERGMRSLCQFYLNTKF